MMSCSYGNEFIVKCSGILINFIYQENKVIYGILVICCSYSEGTFIWLRLQD